MLQLNDISKTFNPGTVTEKRALNHLTLDLKDGDFATVVGSNGAGKSTMFNAIAGSFYVDEGTIMLDGEDVTFQKEYRLQQRDRPPVSGSSKGHGAQYEH